MFIFARQMIIRGAMGVKKSEWNDESLFLHRLCTGDKSAFGICFQRYYASLCFFANKFLKNEETAKDVVQDVFVRLYEKKYDFPNLIALKSFLYSSVQHRALNFLEKENNRAKLRQQIQLEEYETDCFHQQIEAEMFEQIFAAIEELPTECRRIFKMSYIEHLDTKQIMERLQIAESTIKTQRRRAKKMLRERLKHLYPLAVLLFS